MTLISTPVSNLTPLASLRNLEVLQVSGIPIRNINLTPLAGLKKLERLALQHMLLIDLTPLAGLSSLKELDLYDASFSDEHVNSVQQALPNCIIKR